MRQVAYVGALASLVAWQVTGLRPFLRGGFRLIDVAMVAPE